MRIPSGTTDQYVYFIAVDLTDMRTRKTGLSSFTVYRSRNGAAAVAMTTPTVNETDSVNMPGVYELLLDEDMTIGAGNDSEEMVFHITQADMAPVTRSIELYRPKITAGNTLTVSAGGESLIDNAQVVDDVWDEPLTGASHNAPTSAGKRLRQVSAATLVLEEGTAQAGTATTITLAVGASATDDLYHDAYVSILSGTGIGQIRPIIAYDGTTKIATVSKSWAINPASDSEYVISGSSSTDLHTIRDDTVSVDNLKSACDAYSAERGLSGTALPAAAADAAGGLPISDAGGLDMDALAAAGDPWSIPLPGAYGAGTAGKILGDNLDVPVSDVRVYLDPASVSTLASVASPAISLAKDSSEPHPLLIITDAAGDPIDLSGKTLRLNVWNPDDGSSALAEQTFTTADKLSIGGADNNQVTLDHAASDVPAAVERKYDLWNVTDNYLLAQGQWSVYQTVLTATV